MMILRTARVRHAVLPLVGRRIGEQHQIIFILVFFQFSGNIRNEAEHIHVMQRNFGTQRQLVFFVKRSENFLKSRHEFFAGYESHGCGTREFLVGPVSRNGELVLYPFTR